MSKFMEDIQIEIKTHYNKTLHDNRDNNFRPLYINMDRTSTINTILHGSETMTNKKLIIRQDTDNNNNPYDWTITLLNSYPKINLFTDILKFKRIPIRMHEYIGITTKDIIDYLVSRGVKNILFFDFTCSPIQGEGLTDRDIREIKKEINGNFGGNIIKKGSITKSNFLNKNRNKITIRKSMNKYKIK
jgi:hypothetical protein